MQGIKDIKIMLLGIAIILFTIVLHLFLQDGLLTDLIAIIGLLLVIVGYKEMKADEKPQSVQQEDTNDKI